MYVLFRHTLYLELSARILATKFGMYGLERPNNNALIQMIQMKGRTKSLKGIISNSDIKQCLKILKDGKIVMYGPDQDYRNKHSIISSFYGKRCLTTTVPAKLKKISGCNVVYFDFFRVSGGFRAVIKDFNNKSDSEKKFAENLSEVRLVLIDGVDLAEYMIEYNVGVQVKETIKVAKIDQDFFSGEE